MLPLVIILYFSLLIIISKLISKRFGKADYYTGFRQSPWMAVAFGMIGASVSGVSFVSVPGMVTSIKFSYIELCFGFILGYIAVAYILLPIYYRLNLSSIYGYLEERFGIMAKRTGSVVFILSKAINASAKFYIATLMLWKFALDEYHIPFVEVLIIMLILTYIYAGKGIRTLVWTDCLQTLMMIAAIVLLLHEAASQIGLDLQGTIKTIAESPDSQIFDFNPNSKYNFFKQLISGAFIVIVMTGLDQDMMQKNLTCKDLHSAQKNMIVYGTGFVPLNLLLLSLGLLSTIALAKHGINDTTGDSLLFSFARTASSSAKILFTLGILSSALSSIDSSIVSLTTSISLDLFSSKKISISKTKILTLASILTISLLFHIFSKNSNAIDLIYTIVSFLYGPLLGMFFFGIFTQRKVEREWIFPFVAIISPIFAYAVNHFADVILNYKFGYEILLINGFFAFLTLFLSSKKQ